MKFAKEKRELLLIHNDNHSDDRNEIETECSTFTNLEDSGLGQNATEFSINSEVLIQKARYKTGDSTCSSEFRLEETSICNGDDGGNEHEHGHNDEKVTTDIVAENQKNSDSISHRSNDKIDDHDRGELIKSYMSSKNIADDDSEDDIEEDIRITELDSVSNQPTPAPSMTCHADDANQPDSPRVEPAMHKQEDVMSRDDLKILDTPREVPEIQTYNPSNYYQIDIPTTKTKNEDTSEADEIMKKKLSENDFEAKINKAIESIEDEEAGHKAASPRMSEEQLENLKQKCLDRLQNSQKEEYTQNSCLKDFSSSKKLLKFLEESEEKDEQMKHKVKTVSYSMNSNIPKLGDLLAKPASELAEEVLTLHLGKSHTFTIAINNAPRYVLSDHSAFYFGKHLKF